MKSSSGDANRTPAIRPEGRDKKLDMAQGLPKPGNGIRGFVKACMECGLHDQGKKATEEFDTLYASWTAEHGAERRNWEKAREDDRQGAEPPAQPLRPDPLLVEALFSLQSLRHTLGVMCARGGMSLLEIGELLGHSSVVATARYAKFMPLNVHRRAQAARCSSGFAGIASLPKQLSPDSPQTARKKARLRRKRQS